MNIRVFTSQGCIRCTIVKHYLAHKGMPFEEHDIKTEEGNAAFKAFYRDHRAQVRRDAAGIFFPVVDADGAVLQDAGSTLAWLEGGAALAALITPNNLGHGWTGGVRVDACDAATAAAFVTVLRRLKTGGLRIEAETSGGNAALLRALLEENLLDRCIFHVRCADTAAFTGSADALPPDWAASVAAACAAHGVERRFRIDVGGGPDGAAYSPQEAARAAEALHHLGGNRLPCCVADSSGTAGNLFPYRTAVRRWQVLADVC